MEAHDETEEDLAEHFEEWTFDASLPMKRLQNYYIDGQNETPVQRKFRADFYVDQTGEGLETALYLPGGITTGIQGVSGGEDFDMHYLLHCREGDTECAEVELGDGTVVAWTTDTTYIEAAAFFPDGSVATVWWGDMDGDEVDVTVDQIAGLAADLDTGPVWEALKADSES